MTRTTIAAPVRATRRTRRAGLVTGLVLATGLLASPALAPASGDPAPAAVEVSAPAATAYGVQVTGAVAAPLRVTRAQLAALPQKTLRLTYQASGVDESHTFRGPLLTDVLALAEPTYDPAVKNDLLRFAVLATATDGYAAVVSMGEVAPDFGATPVLVALRQDGVQLERPRLAVRGDVRGGRYVTDLKSLKVVRLG